MSVRLMAVGDMFLRTANEDSDPYVYVTPVLARADIVFGNLEAPLTDVRTPSLEQSVLLKSSPSGASALQAAHFTVVNLAHNHICDYGTRGVLDTIRHLDEAGLLHVGVGRTIPECLKEAVVEIDGQTTAFVGFYQFGPGLSSNEIHIAGVDPQLVGHRIAELKARYDYVVVSMHWGRENVFYPAPEQQILARRCIMEGATVVVGHHPHYVQGIEEYGGGLILYSLGNFNFWQFDMATNYFHRASCIADIYLSKSRVRCEMIPVMIDESYRPRPISDGDGRKRFEDHIRRISRPLENGIDKWWWYGEIAIPYLTNNGRSFIRNARRYGVKHLFKMARWLTSRFVLKCYVGLFLRYLRPKRRVLRQR